MHWFLMPLAAAVISSTVSFGVNAADNIILIQADDMTPGEMIYMPQTNAYLRNNGTTFTNAFVSNAMCCPSRVTTLTGNYSHNTGIHNNSGPQGGFGAFHAKGMEASTVATRMKAAGYKTAYFGKYLNQYGSAKFAPPSYVPPGWDEWYGLASTIKYYDYRLNENGTVVNYGSQSSDYATDVLGRKAQSVLTTLLNGSQPFFVMLSPFAPHVTTLRDEDEGSRLMATPAPRHENLYPGLKAPRSPSYNEADVSEKPMMIQRLPPISAAKSSHLDDSYRARAQSLRSLDEMVAGLIERLNAHPEGARTYIIFMSDNGYFFGDHRIPDGKGKLYDPSHRVPLLVAGPGVRKNTTRTDLALNTDILPTVMTMAGAAAPANCDGRSLLPLITTATPSTRRSFLMSWSTRGYALRTNRYAYLETKQGAAGMVRELYDLAADPAQMTNIHDKLTPASATALKNAVANLAKCAGAGCRTLEDQYGDALVGLKP